MTNECREISYIWNNWEASKNTVCIGEESKKEKRKREMNSVSAKTYKYWGWLNPSVPCVVPRGLTMMVTLAMSSLGFQLKSRTLTWNCVTDKTRYQVIHSHNCRRISTAQSTKLWRICTTHSMKLWRTRKPADKDGGKYWMWQALDVSINITSVCELTELT